MEKKKKRINGEKKAILKKKTRDFFFFSACAFYLVLERKVNKVMSSSVSIKNHMWGGKGRPTWGRGSRLEVQGGCVSWS